MTHGIRLDARINLGRGVNSRGRMPKGSAAWLGEREADAAPPWHGAPTHPTRLRRAWMVVVGVDGSSAPSRRINGTNFAGDLVTSEGVRSQRHHSRVPTTETRQVVHHRMCAEKAVGHDGGFEAVPKCASFDAIDTEHVAAVENKSVNPWPHLDGPGWCEGYREVPLGLEPHGVERGDDKPSSEPDHVLNIVGCPGPDHAQYSRSASVGACDDVSLAKVAHSPAATGRKGHRTISSKAAAAAIVVCLHLDVGLRWWQRHENLVGGVTDLACYEKKQKSPVNGLLRCRDFAKAK